MQQWRWKKFACQPHSVTLCSSHPCVAPHNCIWLLDGKLFVKGRSICKKLTLMRIFSLRASGEGRSPDSSTLTEDTFSFSPKISTRYWAIFFCCGTLQWFSMDMITGYLKREPHTSHAAVYSFFYFSSNVTIRSLAAKVSSAVELQDLFC